MRRDMWLLVAMVLAVVGCGRTGVDNYQPDMLIRGDLAGPCIVGLPTDPGFTCAGPECGGVEVGVIVPVMSDCGHVGEPCCSAVIEHSPDMRDADQPFLGTVIRYCVDDYAYRCVVNSVNHNATCERCR